MYNFIDTRMTIGTDGAGSAGYNAIRGYGSVTDDTFYDGTIRNLIDNGINTQLMINNSADPTVLPDTLFLTLDDGEPIELIRADTDRWIDVNVDQTPFTDAGIGSTVSVKVYAPSYSIVLVDLDLTRTNTGNDGQYVRLCTAAHDVEWDGYNYSAVGDLLNIEGLDEEAALVTKGTTVTLNGIDPSFRQEIDRNAFRLAPIDILIGQVIYGMNEVQGAQYWHRGTCDSPNTVIDYDADVEQLVIQVSTQSVFGNLDKIPDLVRTSQSSHEATHNGDKFFTYVASTSLGEETWKQR